MRIGETPAAISPQTAFNLVVDRACERLMDRQAKYSIRRLNELEARLAGIDRELDEFLLKKARSNAAGN